MATVPKLKELMYQEMTRKQFLLTLGGLIISIFGLSALFGLLTPDEPKHQGVVEYGMLDYGP